MELSPKQIFDELNQYIVGQDVAKKTIAIALRNRHRRLSIKDEALQDDIIPKNVLMIGPTGVGKTEIVRRASQICNFPFIKVEATRFTEVGYVGKDVESIIRDLLEQNIIKYRTEEKKKYTKQAKKEAQNIVFDKLLATEISHSETDSKEMRKKFDNGEFNKIKIKIDVKEETLDQSSSFEMPGMPGGIQMGIISIGEILGVSKDKYKKVEKTVEEAIKILTEEKLDEMIDSKDFAKMAVKDVQNNGVVFIDEIDKLISSDAASSRGEVSREGVQRDLLPIVEGTTVSTKHGYVDTRHILFIGCGAFYSNKPSDLLPELQGRFPVRAKLKNLNAEDFFKILSSTKNNLLSQYRELLLIDGVDVQFEESGIREIANIADTLNVENENLGARRLYTVVEKMLEELSFEYPKDKSKTVKKVKIDAEYVKKALTEITKDKIEYKKFIL
ncbi:ATP-dependent protease ATPase subunit HslU [Candidatus Deianiraea vastatrix]|uniref:ATP-dependent protease ATPase subunit HslU n=1 Tax=Candidatus Deianiraea vastatrix TaxID=2163644 RepID=A0A5B8XCS0_9RICK|nr:ATP-dependent protease ATPase subunit HslU [Candidatus Deianiraea vastatrix]QED23169.1 ATP-dependent protease ATPase subunit HslU [Candidatus Deianiraea vastatrix]